MKHPGYVLVAVLLVIVVLSLAAYRFMDTMSSAYGVAHSANEMAQARANANSAMHYAMAALADPTTFQQTLSGNPFNNQDFFANVPVGDSSVYRGGNYFALLNLTDGGGGTGEAAYLLQYGLIDEAGKINLNSMMRIDSSGNSLSTMLGLLPNMTDDIPPAIVNWMLPAASADPSAPVYPNYNPANGPMSTLDELLLVQNLTADRLYGNDRNRNGKADPGEADGNDFNRGWSDYLTVYGHELNVDSTGAPRIYVNGDLTGDIRSALTAAIGQEMTDYIYAYRLYSTTGSATPLTKSQRQGTTADLSNAVTKSMTAALTSTTGAPKAKRTVKTSMLSLMNTRVILPSTGGGPNATTLVYDCPLNDRTKFTNMVASIMDKATAKNKFELNPRINVNTAPQNLLAALPGLTADDVTAAIAARQNITPGTAEYATGAWMVTQAGQNPAIFQALEQFITGQTMTYRVHAIGYFANGGPVARVEAVIDSNMGQPRIVYYRDLTDLGGGFQPPR